MKNKILYLIGLLLIILSFILDSLSIINLIILILGIFLIDIEATKNHPKKIIFLFLLPIILLILNYGIDILLVKYFNRIPVFSYEIKSSDKVSTYNSFSYRLFNCNGKLKLDYHYKMNYVCNPLDLEEIDVNAYFNEKTNKYNHKFIKLKGKISKISGVDKIELSPYKVVENNTLNGYVEFNTEYVIRVHTNSDLSNYRIYDDINVIGLVNEIRENDNVIDLNDTLLIPSEIYNNYTFEIIESDKNEITNYVEKDNIYLLGLNNVFVHYDENHIYELNYLITDKRESIDNLIKDKNYMEILDEEKNEIGKNYELDKFNIIICQNDKKIISKSKLKIDYNVCN